MFFTFILQVSPEAMQLMRLKMTERETLELTGTAVNHRSFMAVASEQSSASNTLSPDLLYDSTVL